MAGRVLPAGYGISMVEIEIQKGSELMDIVCMPLLQILLMAIMFLSILMTLFGLLVHVTSMFHLVCLILFLSGLQMLFVAILGQYTTKDYMESKQRPIYIVKETSKNLS